MGTHSVFSTILAVNTLHQEAILMTRRSKRDWMQKKQHVAMTSLATSRSARDSTTNGAKSGLPTIASTTSLKNLLVRVNTNSTPKRGPSTTSGRSMEAKSKIERSTTTMR